MDGPTTNPGEPDPTVPSASDLMEVLEVARSLAASPELQPLLELVEASVLRVLDCDRAGVFVFDERTNELAGRAVTGEPGLRFPADRGIAGAVLREGVAIRLEDAHLDPRFNPEVDRRTGYRTRSLLTVPVRDWDDRPIGVLTALNKRGGAVRRPRRVAGRCPGRAGWRGDPAPAPARPGRGAPTVRARPRSGPEDPARLDAPPPAEGPRARRGRLEPPGRRDRRRLLRPPGPRRRPARADRRRRRRPRDRPGLAGRRVPGLHPGHHRPGPRPRPTGRAGRHPARRGPARGPIHHPLLRPARPPDGRLRYTSAGHGPTLLYRRASGLVEELPPHGCPLGVAPELPKAETEVPLAPATSWPSSPTASPSGPTPRASSSATTASGPRSPATATSPPPT